MRNLSRDSFFKKQAKKQQRYNFKQRKEQLKYNEAFSKMRKYGRQKK